MAADKVQIIYALLGTATGGGAISMLRAYQDNKKVKAETTAIGAKTGPEVTELTVGTMGEVITALRADNVAVRAERDHYRDRLAEVEKRVEFLTNELNTLQQEIGELLSDEAGKKPT